MLSKLLKYELRASGRILLPVYALLLASAGCCSLFYKLAADHPYRTGAASVLMGLLMMAFWIFVVATGAITALLMIYRFYKNYMTDEGYLMFTLPVNRHQLIWAKLLSALLYTAASAVAGRSDAIISTASTKLKSRFLIWSPPYIFLVILRTFLRAAYMASKTHINAASSSKYLFQSY